MNVHSLLPFCHRVYDTFHLDVVGGEDFSYPSQMRCEGRCKINALGLDSRNSLPSAGWRRAKCPMKNVYRTSPSPGMTLIERYRISHCFSPIWVPCRRGACCRFSTTRRVKS